MANKKISGKLCIAGLAICILCTQANKSTIFQSMKTTGAKITSETVDNNFDNVRKDYEGRKLKKISSNETIVKNNETSTEESTLVKNDKPVTTDINEITSSDYDDFIKLASSNNIKYIYSSYYDIDEALNNTNSYLSNKSYNVISSIDTIPSFDVLYSTITNNNNSFFYTNINNGYYKLDDEIIRRTCNLIIESLNNNINDLDDNSKARVYEELKNLKVIGADSTNKKVSSEVYNALYDAKGYLILDITQINKYGSEEALDKTILHEIAHIYQKELYNNNQVGASLYNSSLKVNPLIWSFINETTAESNSMEITSSNKPLVYSKQYAYLRALNFSALINPNYDEKAFEKANKNFNPDDIYNMYNATTYQEKVEVIDMLYSLDIALSKRTDFYNNYDGNDSKETISNNLLASSMYTNTRYFYTNLAERVENGNATLEDCLYLIKMYEITLNSCINYELNYDSYQEFITSYTNLQNDFFNYLSIKTNKSLDDIISLYNIYTYNKQYTNVPSLNWLKDSEKDYIFNCYVANTKYSKANNIREYQNDIKRMTK